ncbi:sulfur carrier protein ThiS [Ktedonosporobacter rubrisoli]|uniref:Sulfur carrier protein ThiS n=1 Tax=Ktedonosporobacter rubrisoli TaxID=2509675 RepID=A0A4P6JPG4_KTERU|nr:sulfur carrier protein ThiS [Ktedonosporobacter rubrisoli]QBD76656.1 sulfur carrier protein ThiS [Ktedonosporobacter rubrisoli]
MSEKAQEASEAITIIANGQPHTIEAGCSIAHFLATLHIRPEYVVAQLDGAIVPRNVLDKTLLMEGQRLEIVTMVGGG